MTEQKTLVLIDGSSYLYRAFHAMPDLRAIPGDPTSAATGAIRGFINMVGALRKEVPADYAVCVFDAPGGTFRDEIYPCLFYTFPSPRDKKGYRIPSFA